jgi:hypothetical protein
LALGCGPAAAPSKELSMRSTMLASFLVLSTALALFAAGCNNTSPPRLYATMAWKMRCPNAADFAEGCAMGCTEGMDRLIDDFAGEGGTSITCNVTESGTSRILNFRIGSSAGQSVSFQNVAIPTTGGSALSGTVRFREDNDYTGVAGANPPSGGQPCQVSNVTFFSEPESGDPTIRGYVLCGRMRADADMRICRGLSMPGGSATAMDRAEFTIYGCPGLRL